ncbi:MAG: hypothetical protein ABID54_01245 [Pseudomonadota bacterium]
MADYYINIFLDEGKSKRIENAGLTNQIKEIGGKKAIQIGVTQKEHKKLCKSFPNLTVDASNSYVLPEEAEKTLMDFVVNMKTVDVMKAAIMKLYSPLAGKEIRSKMH